MADHLASISALSVPLDHKLRLLREHAEAGGRQERLMRWAREHAEIATGGDWCERVWWGAAAGELLRDHLYDPARRPAALELIEPPDLSPLAEGRRQGGDVIGVRQRARGTRREALGHLGAEQVLGRRDGVAGRAVHHRRGGAGVGRRVDLAEFHRGGRLGHRFPPRAGKTRRQGGKPDRSGHRCPRPQARKPPYAPRRHSWNPPKAFWLFPRMLHAAVKLTACKKPPDRPGGLG